MFTVMSTYPFHFITRLYWLPSCKCFMCIAMRVCVLGEREREEWQPRSPLKPFTKAERLRKLCPLPERDSNWFCCVRGLSWGGKQRLHPGFAFGEGISQVWGNEPYELRQQSRRSSWTASCRVLPIAGKQRFEWSDTTDLLLFPDKWACPLLALLTVSKGKALLV